MHRVCFYQSVNTYASVSRRKTTNAKTQKHNAIERNYALTHSKQNTDSVEESWTDSADYRADVQRKIDRTFEVCQKYVFFRTELIYRRLRRSQNACFKCLVVKFNEDDRYSDLDMATHDGQKVAAIKAAKLEDVFDAAKDYDVIGVDEGQFVSKTQMQFVCESC